MIEQEQNQAAEEIERELEKAAARLRHDQEQRGVNDFTDSYALYLD